jgi:hypothetical protein
MSALATWLGHPKAVSQRLYIVDGKGGMYQCKTRRGKLVVLHHYHDRNLPEAVVTTIKAFDSENPAEANLFELARQDPRHAIAAALAVELDAICPENAKFQPKGMSLVPRGFGINGIGE